jgi:hypothetical protein
MRRDSPAVAPRREWPRKPRRARRIERSAVPGDDLTGAIAGATDHDRDHHGK